MSGTSTKAPKKPGRKSMSLQEQLAHLERNALLVKQKLKADRDRNFAALGQALLMEGKANPEVMKLLRETIPRHVIQKGVLAGVIALLDE